MKRTGFWRQVEKLAQSDLADVGVRKKRLVAGCKERVQDDGEEGSWEEQMSRGPEAEAERRE